MEEKFPLDVSLVEELANQPLLAAYLEMNHLKRLFRQGWLQAGVPREYCESVAEHVFGMTLLAWMVVESGLVADVNRDRVMQMTLVHEIGEIYTGDITPGDGVAVDEKHRREREGVLQVTNRLPNGAEWMALWEEFEAGETNEARLVRQLDRLEMALQAWVYEKQLGMNLEGFFQSAERAVNSPELKDMLKIIGNLR
ncbi:predicted hydrolases of HD superfamily [Anaerolinea thermolimosa]|uniref:HD domain-containing protein n=1 Tax=Anaerolinea thermolimosa TaxID=229919 RepID=UPI000783C693|nr:HD domain-containing protein [Anaerolinea thermolimosa]GAP07296.1 predicted hydrolases of HD superfamily [Anaerolinea thermolimosa]